MKLIEQIFLGVITIILAYSWLSHLVFYFRNDWDFSKDLGGPMTLGENYDVKLSPKAKFFVGYPLLLVGSSYGFFHLTF